MTRRNIPTAVVGLIAALTLAGCTRVPSRPGEKIVPKSPGDPAPVEESRGGETLVEADGIKPRITLDPGDEVLQTLNADLDGDSEEEQLIAVKRKDELDSHIRILVADSDPSKGAYFYKSSDLETGATNTVMFALSLKDLVGDHGLQIVASGMNAESKSTLDVFRRPSGLEGKERGLKLICGIVADEVRIEETDRPESYFSEGKSAAGFTIVAYLRDVESANVLDRIRITWRWKPRENRYVPESTEKIPGAQVERKQLESLSTVDAFEEFLSGSWVQASTGAAVGEKDKNLFLIDFQPRGRRISLFSEDTQEVYIWKESFPSLPYLLIVAGENEAVRTIKKSFLIAPRSLTTIDISIRGSDLVGEPYSRYLKVTEEIQAGLLTRSGSRTGLSGLKLEGVYTGREGIVVDFRAGSLTWKEGNRQRHAAFVVFAFDGRDMLSLRFLDGRGDVAERHTWLVDYREKKDSTRVVKTLVLSPVQLTVSGYEDAVGETLTLEQAIDLKGR